MPRVTHRTLPWAITTAIVLAALVFYFGQMLDVTARISRERDELEALTRAWVDIEIDVAETVAPGPESSDADAAVSRFDAQLGQVLDLPWIVVLRGTYPLLRARSDTVRAHVSTLVGRSARSLPSWRDIKSDAKRIESDLGSLVDWIDTYSAQQMRAFRVLLVFLVAAVVFAAAVLVGVGNRLRTLERRFLAAIDSMSDALLLTDANGIVLHANPAARRLFAADVGRLQGNPVPEALTSALSKGATQRDAAPPETEASLADSEGRQHPVSLKVEDIREPSGRFRGSVYLVRDLTEWRKLVASIESTFVTLQAEDADRAVQRALDDAASLCGAPLRALLLFGGPDSPSVPILADDESEASPDMPADLEEWFRRVAEKGEPVFCSRETADAEAADLFARNSIAWAAVIPLRFADTVTGAIVLASRTSTAPWGEREMAAPRMVGNLVMELLSKKWAMGEIYRLGLEYRDLIEHANAPIWGVDREGRVNEWNRAIAEATGREKSHVIGLSAESLVESGKDRADLADLLKRVLAGERVADNEIRFLTVAEGPLTLLLSGSPRTGASGAVAGAILIGQDISVRVEGERRSREQARAIVEVQEIERRRISRELHDDVAQNLSAAGLVCETLFDGEDGSPRELRARVDRLSEAIASALRSIRGIAYDLRSQDLDHYRLVGALERLCDSFGREHSIDATFQSAGVERIPLEPEEAVHIYRVAQEALSNAQRHASARRVSVSLVVSHPDLILRVVDDGTGFDVKRAHGEAADHRSMGLSGMRERATILGATLTVTSRKGKGTQVKMTMPLAGREGT